MRTIDIRQFTSDPGTRQWFRDQYGTVNVSPLTAALNLNLGGDFSELARLRDQYLASPTGEKANEIRSISNKIAQRYG